MAVSRFHLQILFGIAATGFVAVQLYLYYRGPAMHPIDFVRMKSRAYTMVKGFLDLCDDSQVHMILVDPWILRELVHENLEDAGRPCRFLCKNHIYTFALLDEDFEEFKLIVLPKMKDNGFSIRATYDSHSDDVPTHLNLRDHDNHAIHVVVFHRRDTYWWYGADLEDEYKLDFTQHQGALELFEYEYKVPLDGIDVYMPHYPKKFVEEYEKSTFIPCNLTRANIFHSKYPKDISHNATQFRDHAVQAIQLTKRRLDDFNVPFWLSSGTLLGWFRQCDVIPYSVDVDLGILIKDHPTDLLDRLKATGMRLDHKFGRVDDSLQYTFDMGLLKLDMFFFYEDKTTGKVWNGGTDYETGAKYRYTFEKFDLCWTEFFNMKVRVPCQTESYIKANYGDDWFHPVKNWDWKSSPPNVEEVASWRTEELDEVIQLFDKNGKREYLEWINDEL